MAENNVTYLCVVRLLLDSTTVLEGLFGEYPSSSAALGKQRPLSHHDGGMSTALSPTSSRGQGMGFIV